MLGAICYGETPLGGYGFLSDLDYDGSVRIQINRYNTTFYADDVWQLEATLTDPKTKTPVTPSTVTVTVTRPNGEELAPNPMVELEDGVYTTNIYLTEPGKWHAVITATGEYQGTKPESITVLGD